jgi:TonB-dependent receptor
MKNVLFRLVLGASVSAFALAAGAVSVSAQDATTGAAATSADATVATDTANDEKVVVITARRKALQSATELKKNSDTMIDSVVADEAGRLPDNSITEVLARIPGVTMSRFNGSGDSFQVEGSGIQVRGLSNPSSTLNGREIFGANGGSPLSWGEVTPELMAGVDVYKATRADMIEGGTGGAIDLRTKMPFDYRKPAVEGSVGASYGDLTGKISPSISALVTKRFETPVGEMGLLVDVAYSKLESQSGHLSIEPYYKKQYNGEDRYIPGGFGWGDDHFQRERKGFYEAFQWKPNDNLTIFQTLFISNYTSNNDGTSVWVSGDHIMPTSGNATFDSNGVLVTADHMSYASFGDGNAGSTIGQGWLAPEDQVDCNTPYGTTAYSLNWGASPPNCSRTDASAGSSRGFSTTDNTTRDFSQGFTWNVNDRARVRGAVQFVDSSASSTGMSVGLFVPVTGFSADLSGDLPKFLIDNSDALDARNSYGWSQLSWRPSNNHGTMTAANLDVDYQLGDGFFKTLSFGTRFASRVEHDNYDGTYWTPLGNGWDGSDQKYLSDGPEADGEYYGFDNFFHDQIQVPHTFYVPSADLIKTGDYSYIMNAYGYYKSQTKPDGTLVQNPDEVMHVAYGASRTAVRTDSYYIQAKFGSETGLFGVPYTGNIGLRYVRTHTDASGNFVFNQSQFYMSQADANADFTADPTGTLTPRAVKLSADVEPRSDSSNDIRILPTFNINFKPSDKFFIRLAANQTVSRPSFGDITVAGSGSAKTLDNTNNYTETVIVDGNPTEVQHKFVPVFNGVSTSIGNTTLRPTMSSNYDLSLEWYKSQSTSAHLALFHKDLKDLVIFGDTIVPFPYSFTKQDGTVVIGTSTLTASQATNADKIATISGFEFGGRTFFDGLPGFWSGFGIEANFTYIDSHNPAPKAYDMNGDRFTDLPVVGLSKYSANLQLMYSKGPLYVGLAYNWRNRFLMSTNTNGTGGNDSTYTYCSGTAACAPIHYSLPLWGRAYGQLDFGANYKFSDHIKVFLQASNLTNETAISDMEILPNKFYARNFYESDRRIDVGLNFAF